MPLRTEDRLFGTMRQHGAAGHGGRADTVMAGVVDGEVEVGGTGGGACVGNGLGSWVRWHRAEVWVEIASVAVVRCW